MLWLGLHFPRLGLEVFASAGSSSAPLIAPSRPLVLVEDNRVVLRNSAAQQAGIALGSTLATAASIVPGLKHCVRDPGREQQRLRQIAETLYRLSAHVSTAPPAGIVLEVSGSLRLFGGIQALQEQTLELTAALGHSTRHHAANTPLAALLLARTQQCDVGRVPLIHSGLPVVSIERLANMGIHTLGPLLELPPKALGQRFGLELLDFLQRLIGQRPDPRAAIIPAAEFCSSLHLLDAINSKDALLFPMQRLAAELQHWLIGRQLGVERLSWTFAAHTSSTSSEQCTSCELPVRFAKAQQSRSALMGISRLRLDQAELPADVVSITLQAQRLVPWQRASQELFQPLPGQSAVDPSELLDQLRARLGHHACYGIRSTRQHAPEWSWRKVAPRTRARTSARSGTKPARKSDLKKNLKSDLKNDLKIDNDSPGSARRPLWLFDPPRLTERRMLTLLRGPERIQTGWWQQTLRRDYYVARHKNGAECWAFVDPQDHWYLHGYFA